MMHGIWSFVTRKSSVYNLHEKTKSRGWFQPKLALIMNFMIWKMIKYWENWTFWVEMWIIIYADTRSCKAVWIWANNFFTAVIFFSQVYTGPKVGSKLDRELRYVKFVKIMTDWRFSNSLSFFQLWRNSYKCEIEIYYSHNTSIWS